jgi:hypothetical protein
MVDIHTSGRQGHGLFAAGHEWGTLKVEEVIVNERGPGEARTRW